MNWYVECWKKYADFTGRARRKEYWMFILFNFLIAFGLGIVDGILGTSGTLGGLYALAVLIPGLAVTARRLHDTDRSGWWQLILIVPIVGVLIMLFFVASDSKPGENRFGRNPKEM